MNGSRWGISMTRKSAADDRQYHVRGTAVPSCKNRSTFKPYSALLGGLAVYAFALLICMSHASKSELNADIKNIGNMHFIGDSLSASWSTTKRSKGFVYRISSLASSQHISTSFQIESGISASFFNRHYSVPMFPGIVIAELGTNDFRQGSSVDQFETDYNQLINGIRQQGASDLVCIGVFQGRSDRQEAFDRIIEDSCLRSNGAFVSIFDLFDRPGNRGPVSKKSWKGFADLGHPNDRGHDIIYKRLVAKIGIL
ncbi:SGNH/GDSL hydrolase family protein, partial [Glutamicibacter sp. BSL13]